MIDKFEEDERECLLSVAGIPEDDGEGVAEKAIRIIDEQAAALERLTVFTGTQTDECARLRAENDRLAAANALLKRAGSALNVMLDQLATRNQTSIRGSAVAREVYSFLANQPAAPTHTVEHDYPEVTGYEKPTRTEAERKPHRRECTAEWCDIGCDRAAELAAEVRQRVSESTMDAKRQVSSIKSPAVCALFDSVTGQAPARSIYDPPWTSGTAVDHIPCLEAIAAISARTEAEQAVLDACAALPESTIRMNAHGRSLVGWPGSVCNVWSAELARRGLK